MGCVKNVQMFALFSLCLQYRFEHWSAQMWKINHPCWCCFEVKELSRKRLQLSRTPYLLASWDSILSLKGSRINWPPQCRKWWNVGGMGDFESKEVKYVRHEEEKVPETLPISNSCNWGRQVSMVRFYKKRSKREERKVAEMIIE